MVFSTWRRGYTGVALVCCALLWGESIRAQEESAGSTDIGSYLNNPEDFGGRGNEYITLDVRDKDLSEILKFISRRVGINVIADPDVDEKVTIQLDAVDWRDAIHVLARQTHCEILDVSDRLVRFTQPPSISMEFQDADIKIVLELLAKQAGANIMMASDIQGKVSLSLREVPWREALSAIVKTAGYVIVTEDTASLKEILRIVRPETLKQQLETRHFQLRYIRPGDPYEAIITGIETFATGAFAGTGTSGSFNAGGASGAAGGFSLAEALKNVVSENGNLDYDSHTNTFIVKDTKPKLDEIHEIIRLVDVMPPLLYVEVKFISTANSDILERGIKFDLPNTPERDGFQTIIRAGEPDPSAIDPLFQFGGTYPFDIGDLDDVVDDFSALGVLDLTETRMVLRMLKDDENSRIVQEPALTMVDNKAGVIFVGETVPFAVQQIQVDQNGNVSASIDENKRSPINVGFTLYMLPHVIPGTDMVNMTVIPRVSTLTGTTSTIDGFDRFEFSQESTGAKTFIDLPRESAQTVVTSLRVHDGHTAVIGGLQTERKIEIESKVPLLSNLPLIGNLFTWKRKKNNVESLIIMITPHILKNVKQDDKRFEDAYQRHKERDYFYKKYDDDSPPPKRFVSDRDRS